jgi:hypothetical protein
MGRWAQYRKRGTATGEAAAMIPAPDEEDWEVHDLGGGEFQAMLDVSLPGGADTWGIQWRLQTGPGAWHFAGAAGSDPINVGDLDADTYEVEAAWFNGAVQISPYSDIKTVDVTA